MIPCDWLSRCGAPASWTAVRFNDGHRRHWCNTHMADSYRIWDEHGLQWERAWAIYPIVYGGKREGGDENRSLHNGAEEASELKDKGDPRMCSSSQYDFGGDTDNRDGQGAGNAFVRARDAYLAEAASLRREALFLRADADAKDAKANVIIGEVGDPLDSDGGGG